MPQKIIKFTGINRNTNKFNGVGECEELINLRPVPSGGHRVIKYKRVLEQQVQYDQFFEHVWGEYYNQIVVMDGRVIWKNTGTGRAMTITDEFEGLAVSISFAGNVLMIYCEEVTKQLVFKFEDGEYVPFSVAIKPITDVRVEYNYLQTGTATYVAGIEANTETGHEEALSRAASAFYSANPHGLCGAALIGCEYELKDGNKQWSTAFVVANVTEDENYKDPVIGTFNNQDAISVFGVRDVTLHLTFANTDASEIRRINVYATRPVFPYSIVRKGESLSTTYEIEKQSLEDMNLAGQVMYFQGSISPDEKTASLLLNFGPDQAGEAIMDVNSGCVDRTGDAISYNNRFHFFKSKVNHIIQQPTTSSVPNTADASEWVAYVKVNDSWVLVNKRYMFSEAIAQDFIYPMSGIKQIMFVKAYTSEANGAFTVPYDEYFTVDLKNSTAYNYSYAFGVTPTVVPVADDWYDEIVEAGQTWSRAQANGFTEKVNWKRESNAINVSAPYNPFVFPVEYSYGFGGEIIDIVTSYLPVSAVQYGQYPITVFTTNGIYALEQGNGSVLYGNIVPLQPYVLDGPALATPAGTFFVSSKNLYLLAGREALCVSIALNGKRELNLRNLDSYNALCFDLAQMITKEDFEDYLASVTLFYDTFQNELWVCSRNMITPYSYVFNLDTKMFYKSHNKYTSQQIASRYAIEFNCLYGNSSLVDVYDENDGANMPILLQSRPMPLEVFYTHIQRMLMFADAELTYSNKLCVSVFGSDNLQDWKCIISAQKKDVILKQVRTNKAAKSYRDYIILVSGSIASDTDLSDIIADYTVVQRRLG